MERRKYDELNYVPPKKLDNYCFYEHYETGNRLVFSREMTFSANCTRSHNYNRNNYLIRPHLDVIVIFIYPCFFRQMSM